jgi:DNA modification methylase
LGSTHCYIIWDKRGGLPDVPYSPIELAWTSFDKQPKLYTVINHGFIRDGNDPRLHPAQKPLVLMMRIIDDFTDLDQTILDPFMGSGTTGIACIRTGRKFIGIEINPDYFTITEERIREEYEKPSLLPVLNESYTKMSLFDA